MDTQKLKQRNAALVNEVNNLRKKIKNSSLSPSGKSRSAQRRARRSTVASGQKTVNFVPGGPGSVNNLTVSKASDTGLRRLRMTPRSGLTDHGIAFLKCAFAPPDFQSTSVLGIPDDYRGASLTRKHRYVAPISFVSTSDYYIILLPTPGVAYWIASVAAGSAVLQSTIFQPVYYTDAAQMFGAAAVTASNVTKFRFVSNHIELIPTVNQMIWSGSVQAWKAPVTLITRQDLTTANGIWSVTGLESCNSNLSNQYSGPFIMGLYSACYNSNGTFPFTNIQENIGPVPAVIDGADFGQLATAGGNGFTGLDNQFESLIVKVSGMTANETSLLKTWACVEYQANPSSTLYEFQSLSMVDPVAIELYRSIISELPVGVPFEDNESFWTRVLQIVHQLSGVGSLLPGPYGMASRGVNLLSGAGLSLLK